MSGLVPAPSPAPHPLIGIRSARSRGRNAAQRRAGSAEDERRELSGEDHRAKRAPERARAANDLVKRPHEQCSVAYAVDRGRVRGRKFEPPQHQRDHPDAQRRVRQLPQGQPPVRGAEPPGGGAQASGDGVGRRGGGHVEKVPSVEGAKPACDCDPRLTAVEATSNTRPKRHRRSRVRASSRAPPRTTQPGKRPARVVDRFARPA